MSVNCDFACLYEYEESIGGGSRGARASSRWTAVPVPHGEVSSSRDMAGLHFRGRRWRYRLARRRLAAVSAESLLSRASNILLLRSAPSTVVCHGHKLAPSRPPWATPPILAVVGHWGRWRPAKMTTRAMQRGAETRHKAAESPWWTTWGGDGRLAAEGNKGLKLETPWGHR